MRLKLAIFAMCLIAARAMAIDVYVAHSLEDTTPATKKSPVPVAAPVAQRPHCDSIEIYLGGGQYKCPTDSTSAPSPPAQQRARCDGIEIYMGGGKYQCSTDTASTTPRPEPAPEVQRRHCDGMEIYMGEGRYKCSSDDDHALPSPTPVTPSPAPAPVTQRARCDGIEIYMGGGQYRCSTDNGGPAPVQTPRTPDHAVPVPVAPTPAPAPAPTLPPAPEINDAISQLIGNFQVMNDHGGALVDGKNIPAPRADPDSNVSGYLSIRRNGTFIWAISMGRDGAWQRTADPDYPIVLISRQEKRRFYVGCNLKTQEGIWVTDKNFINYTGVPTPWPVPPFVESPKFAHAADFVGNYMIFPLDTKGTPDVLILAPDGRFLMEDHFENTTRTGTYRESGDPELPLELHTADDSRMWRMGAIRTVPGQFRITDNYLPRTAIKVKQ